MRDTAHKLFKLKFYSDTKKAKSIYALVAILLLSTMNILILFFHSSFQRWDTFSPVILLQTQALNFKRLNKANNCGTKIFKT